MIEIINREECSGCSACENICPVHAIRMVEDYEGFPYPQIDTTTCVHCNKCEQVCPISNYERLKTDAKEKCIYKKAYGAKNIDAHSREFSSSGGVFWAVASEFIRDGGFVVGAAFDDGFQVRHKLVNSLEELPALRGSKYIQSSINLIYKDVKRLLVEGKKVLFTGLTCQIEGLMGYLGKEYDNLYLIDLICLGIPSPGVWRGYLETFFKSKKIKSINFKDKSQGWHNFSVAIEFENGGKYLETGFDNYFMEAMFKGFTLRPSCFSCKFKSEIRRSDITIADCWGCENYLPEMDDNKGTSMVIVHSKKGMKLLNLLKMHCVIKEFDYANVLSGNPNYYHRVERAKKRGLFTFIYNNLSKRWAFTLMCKNPQKTFIGRVKRKIARLSK